MAGLRWGATSDVGRVRPVNQDSVLAELPLFAVADGMGGHAAGEVASQLALGVARMHLGGGGRSGSPTLDGLVDAVAVANRAVFEQARQRPELRGMGTTFCALSLLADTVGPGLRLAVVNVGDSRGYVLTADGLHQLTRDHSYVEDLVEAGEITPAEARSHPQRHIVTRALGVEPNVLVDTWERPATPGERYLLCSDGLTNELDDSEIETALRTRPSPQDAADDLVQQANARGARDNVSVLVVDVVADGYGGRIEVPAPPAGMAPDDLRMLANGPALGTSGTPSWADVETPGGNETVDEPRAGDPTTGSPAAAGTDAGRATSTPAPTPGREGAPRRRRPRRRAGPSTTRTVVRNAAFVVVLLGILAFAYGSVRAYGRAGWYVTFRSDQVTLYRGKPEGVLWVKPQAVAGYPLSRRDLTAEWATKLDARIPFTTRAAADRWFTLLAANPDAIPHLATATTPTTTTTTTPGGATTTTATGATATATTQATGAATPGTAATPTTASGEPPSTAAP